MCAHAKCTVCVSRAVDVSRHRTLGTLNNRLPEMHRLVGKIDPVAESCFLFRLFAFSNFLSFTVLGESCLVPPPGRVFAKNLELVRLSGQE